MTHFLAKRTRGNNGTKVKAIQVNNNCNREAASPTSSENVGVEFLKSNKKKLVSNVFVGSIVVK